MSLGNRLRKTTDVRRRVCFVTGTRAEFGLMRSTLDALRRQKGIALQIIATGMHLDHSRGRSVTGISDAGFPVDRVVPWRKGGDASQTQAAIEVGRAVSGLAKAFDELQTEIVLVAGDRVEAFAAATAGHIGGRIVAHVHGGDRALGLIDDSLRHAITKLAHVHFPATRQSAERIARLGEDAWRIHRVGSPGLDGIRKQAAPWPQILDRAPGLKRGLFALLSLHPATPDAARERRAAEMLFAATCAAGFEQIVAIYPNNDPGSVGIAAFWNELSRAAPFRPGGRGSAKITIFRDLPRPVFLGLLRNAAVLAGNSSAGIIEAASFGTPVIDIGPRQTGRERSKNTVTVPINEAAIRQSLDAVRRRLGKRLPVHNVYGGDGAGEKIARNLSRLDLVRSRQKLISS